MSFFINKLSKKKVILLCVVFIGMYVVYLNYDRALFVEKDIVNNPPAKRCADCHKGIFDQWKKSRHAAAWISKGFKKETENYTKQKCMGCHNPLKISFKSIPDQRKFSLEDGVSCLACHFSENKMYGPYDLDSPFLYALFDPPHPFQLKRVYLYSGFCKGCHVKTFKEWQKTDSIKTCQECHMKTKKDYMMDKFPLNLLHSRTEVADHSLPVLKANAADINVEIIRENEDLTVLLKNINIPHDLPTAQNGDPRIYLEIKFISKDNVIIGEEKEKFASQLGSSLKYNEEWFDTYSIPPESVIVRVSLYLKKPWKTFKEELITKELKINSGARSQESE